jgi:hypothetical protein
MARQPLRVALYPWITSIKGSIERIAELLECDEIDIQICKEIPDWDKFDGAILNNDFRPLPIPRITYLTGMTVRRVLANPEYTRARLKQEDHRGVWTNSNTAALVLREVGIQASCHYRPYPVHVAATPPPLPEEVRVLWYWKPDWAYCSGLDEQILAAMLTVAQAGVQIWVISNKGAPVRGLPDHPAIRALGRCNFREVLPQVRGMVRLTGDLDWGRSNFDVVSAGRWTFNLNAWEFGADDGVFEVAGPDGSQRYHVMSADSIKDAVPKIIDLAHSKHDFHAIHRYASTMFEENHLRHYWQSEIKRVFQ